MISSASPLSSSTSVPCPSAGFHPDPASCSSFLRCTGPGRGHRYLCPAGTRYDPLISNCNHLALAPACNLPIPTQSSPTTTTTTTITSSSPESSTAASTTAKNPKSTTVTTTSQTSSSP